MLPSLSDVMLARRAPELRYQSGRACLSVYGMSRMASVCPCSRASLSAKSMISQWNSPRLGSITSQTHRQYDTAVGGNSGLGSASTSLSVGPSSDQLKGGLSAWPLKR